MLNLERSGLLSRVALRASLALAMVALGAGTALAAPGSGSKAYTGASVSVGKGKAHVVVVADHSGTPTAVAVVLTEAALEGLPAATAQQMEYEYVLPMPKGAPSTGYDHIGLNWNPNGHPPKGIYTVPHFDFHFYLISRARQEAVTFKGANAAAAGAAPAAELVPAGYVIPPETEVEKMGVHGIDPAAPEFHGKPFSATFIYGYYKGHLTFVEPMVAVSYLKTGPDVTMNVKTPKSYSYAGFYPTKYRVGYDSSAKTYMIDLTGLRQFKGESGMAEKAGAR